MSTGLVAAWSVSSYLLGSVSFALLLVRLRTGQDLRSVHSGNLGATNASRVLGRRFGLLIYALDMLKGLVPVLVARFALGDPLSGIVPLSILMGAAAFIGHCWPAWHGFRGGKGVATGSGVVLGLSPFAGLISLGVFILSLAAFRIMSLSSMIAALSLPIAYLFLERSALLKSAHSGMTIAFFILLMALVLLRHKDNLFRIVEGTEPRIGRRSSP